MVNSEFRRKVEELIVQVPYGKVTTYGDLAALAGHPYAARIVGGMAHSGSPELPWHRLVNRLGDCASGYYGGKEGHRQILEAEGFTIVDYRIIDFTERRWHPKV